MRAIQVTQFGGPEVLVPTELDPPVAGPDQLLVEVSAAGVNFADTHRTDGSYRGGVTLPFVPGVEIVGRTDGRRILSPSSRPAAGTPSTPSRRHTAPSTYRTRSATDRRSRCSSKD